MRPPHADVVIMFRLRSKNGDDFRYPSIPAWITGKDMFAAYVSEAFNDFSSIAPDATCWEKLAALKESMFLAASRIKQESSSTAFTDHEQVFWCMMAARGARNRSPRQIVRAIRAFPTLARYFPQRLSTPQGIIYLHGVCTQPECGSYGEIRYEELCERIRSLADDLADVREEAEAAIDVAGDNSRDRKRTNRQICRQVWRPVRRRITIARVAVDPSSAPTAAESAECLREYWSPIFGEKTTDSSAMEQFRPYIASAREYPLVIPSNAEMIELIRGLRNSAPGPDGIPYAAYRAVLSTSAFAFSLLQCRILAGDEVPIGMTSSLMVFIPKEDEVNEMEALLPENVRQLSLGDTDAKIVASMLDIGLASVARTSVVHVLTVLSWA